MQKSTIVMHKLKYSRIDKNTPNFSNLQLFFNRKQASMARVPYNKHLAGFFFFFFFFFLTALLAFYSDTIVVNEKLHVHKCEGEK